MLMDTLGLVISNATDHFVNDVKTIDHVISDHFGGSFNPTSGKAQICKEGCFFLKTAWH